MAQNNAQPVEIGARLRRLRKAAGLSQRELAVKSGVTNAMISLIESNRTNPSVGTLKGVLDGLGVSLADFFAMTAEAEQKVFFIADELVEIGGGRISYRQVGADLRGRTLQILHERMKPGADTGKAMLRHDAQEGGVVLKGRVELTVGTQKRVLRAGDAYSFDSRIPHRFRNVGEDECEIVSACTPPSF
ncbi:MAG: cupin domain-containing protein [Rhodospirillales bacterium]|nr:cupin domain-containing protein [Rhodospirillales bacterium]